MEKQDVVSNKKSCLDVFETTRFHRFVLESDLVLKTF